MKAESLFDSIGTFGKNLQGVEYLLRNPSYKNIRRGFAVNDRWVQYELISHAGSELRSVWDASGPNSGPFHRSMRILCTGQVHERGRVSLFTLLDTSSISCQFG